jgi:hypothetical protein
MPRSRRWWIVVPVILALTASACGGGSSTSSKLTLPPLNTQTSSGSSTTALGASTTAGGTTLGSTSTTRGRVCDTHPGVKCINIRSIAIAAGALVVAWDAINFTPSVSSFHAHFFWDSFAPNQAGTNAAKFGATVGRWELTDKQPFVGADEMKLANRPAAAKNVCVEVADNQHALVDPTVFDCIPIPAS